MRNWAEEFCLAVVADFPRSGLSFIAMAWGNTITYLRVLVKERFQRKATNFYKQIN